MGKKIRQNTENDSFHTLDSRQHRTVIRESKETNRVKLMTSPLTAWRVSCHTQHRNSEQELCGLCELKTEGWASREPRGPGFTGQKPREERATQGKDSENVQSPSRLQRSTDQCERKRKSSKSGKE